MNKVQPLTPTLDKPILDTAGELVGRVTELLFDLAGRIEYVRVALVRAGRDRAAVAVIPWSAVIPPADEHQTWRVLAPKSAVERIARAAPPRDNEAPVK